MFIYQGKLTLTNGPDKADNETLTIIFPNGVVRANDPVYLFTQWTKDDQGIEKAKWFQTLVVEKVKELPDTTDVTFILSGARYTFNITTQQNYYKIKAELSDLTGASASTTLTRRWQAQGDVDLKADLLIWAGSITWKESIVNEQAIFVLPEGYKDEGPVFSSWQWTKDGAGKTKETAQKGTEVKVIGSDDKTAKFSFENYFEIIGGWNTETDVLSVSVKSQEGEAKIGELNLAAKIEPQSHNFDADDRSPVTKKEIELRLPQPQATLPRVLDPLPFPKTLFDTLTQGAAFIDQAAYLAVQAQNRFSVLDADFHKQAILNASLKKDKENAKTHIADLTSQLGTANESIQKGEADLAAAKRAHLDEVKKLRAEFEKHDKSDEATILTQRRNMRSLEHERDELTEKLNKANKEKNEFNRQTKESQAKANRLEKEKAILNNQLQNQTTENKNLSNENRELREKLAKAEGDHKASQKKQSESVKAHAETKTKLAKTEKELRETEATLKSTTNTLDLTKKKLKDAEVSAKLNQDAANDYPEKARELREKADENEFLTSQNMFFKRQVLDLVDNVDDWEKLVIPKEKDFNSPAFDKIRKTFKEIRARKAPARPN